jgi:hypothetical protein
MAQEDVFEAFRRAMIRLARATVDTILLLAEAIHEFSRKTI